MAADLSTEQRSRLIELVRELPVLYDMKLEGYSNREVKRQLWENLAGQLAIPGITADILATKWKNTKDHYDRLRKKAKLPSGSGRVEPPKWVHFEAMKFLDGCNQPLPSASNLASQVLFGEEQTQNQAYGQSPGTEVPGSSTSGTDAASVAGSSSSGSLAPLPHYATPPVKKSRVSDPFEEKLSKLLELAHQEQVQKLSAPAKPRSEREVFGDLVGQMCGKLDEESFEEVQDKVVKLINEVKAAQRKREAEKAEASAGLHNYLTQYEFE